MITRKRRSERAQIPQKRFLTSLDLSTSLDLDLDPIALKIELVLPITIMYLPTKFHQIWSNTFRVMGF